MTPLLSKKHTGGIPGVTAIVGLWLNKKRTKERRKGKLVRGTLGTRQEEGTKVTVVSNSAEDSAAFFDIGCVFDSRTVRMQPIRGNQCVWPSCTGTLL